MMRGEARTVECIVHVGPGCLALSLVSFCWAIWGLFFFFFCCFKVAAIIEAKYGKYPNKLRDHGVEKGGWCKRYV